MKKRILAVALIIGFMLSFVFIPAKAAEGDTVDEPVIEEVVVDEEVPASDVPVYEDEVAEFQAELNATLAAIFAWIGGFSGLAALFAFGLRFIKDRNVMKQIRESVVAANTNSNSTISQVNKLSEVVVSYSKREEAMEKMFITMIGTMPLDPKVKEHIIEGLKNDEFTVQDVIDSGIAQAKQETETMKLTKEKINQTTQSLLSKLTEKDSE